MVKMYSSTGGHHSSLDVTLTDEQRRIVGTSTLVDFCKVGFVEPEQVNSYVCKTCGPVTKQPNAELVITRNVEQQGAVATYSCPQCNKSVALGIIPRRLLKGVDPKYIKFDETGKFRTPTVSDIDDALFRANAAAKMRESYSPNLQIAQKWADQIGHQIPQPLIDELETTYHNAEIAYARDNLEVLTSSVINDPPGLDDNGELTGYTVDEYELLMRTLPDMSVPEDPVLSEKLLRLLVMNEQMYKEHAECLEKQRKSLEEAITQNGRTIADAVSLRQKFEKDLSMPESSMP